VSGPFGDLPRRVGDRLGRRVTATVHVSGGDTGQAYRMTLDDGRSVFVKRRPGAPADLFVAEAHGLAWLAETATVRVPRVLAVTAGDEGGVPAGSDPFLVLEWLEPGPGADGVDGRVDGDVDEQLGRALAALHRFPVAQFGLDRGTFVGPLPQANDPRPTWPAFYAEQRLEPLVRRAVDDEVLPTEATALLERLAGRLPALAGPAEPPSRLHGDLWAGNVVVGPDGGPWLVDPAVYGGHREVDLAMMRLFGGFGPGAFRAYEEVHPLAEGHADRVPLWQLYPLLVHAVLFGGGYASTALHLLRRYGGGSAAG
jgi:fructosamine-3-kinase